MDAIQISIPFWEVTWVNFIFFNVFHIPFPLNDSAFFFCDVIHLKKNVNQNLFKYSILTAQ